MERFSRSVILGQLLWLNEADKLWCGGRPEDT